MSKITLYHGGNLKEGIKSAYSHSSKRWEYGPGLYLTSHYRTAEKYAKGSRKLYKVTIQSGKDINKAELNLDSAIEFINKNVISYKRKDIIKRLSNYETDGMFPAYIMNNVIINENAIKSSKSNALREFYVENGIDYNIESNAFGWGELLMVVFNFDKVINIEESGDEYEDLPKKFSESKFVKVYENIISKFNERVGDNVEGTLTLYHATLRKKLEDIKNKGLVNTTQSPTWYMLSTTLEDAEAHSNPKDDDPIILKYEVPYNGPWKGYPYLYPPVERDGDKSKSKYTGDWYAIKEPLPKEFIKDIIEVDGEIKESSDIETLKSKINSLKINLEPYDDLRTINIDNMVKMEYEVMSDQIYIEHIEVDKSLRGSGLAKLLLNKFLEAVDEKKLPVTLMVYPTDDVTEDELVQIYKKFGFYIYAKDKGNKRPLMRREINESLVPHVPDDVRELNIKSNLKYAKDHGLRTEGDFIYLFHGTSDSNWNKIFKSGKFKNATWFGDDKEISDIYAKRNHSGKSHAEMVLVYMGVILPHGNGYWSSNEELYYKAGRYIPKDLMGEF